MKYCMVVISMVSLRLRSGDLQCKGYSDVLGMKARAMTVFIL